MTNRSGDDEWLVVRCQLGDRQAFDDLVARWHTPLWTCVRRLTGDTELANDITQDVWLRAVRGIGRLRDGAKWRAWLFGIARRVWMDRLRQKYVAPAEVDSETIDLAVGEPDVDRERTLAALDREVAGLPLVEREVLTLFYLQELSLSDVADVLGVPVGTVKSRLHRARHLLRRELIASGGLS